MSRFGKVTAVPTVTMLTSGVKRFFVCEISMPVTGLTGRRAPSGSSISTAPSSGRPALSVTVAETPAANAAGTAQAASAAARSREREDMAGAG